MSENILIVDDEQSILDYLSVLLEKEGYHVFTAISGKKAISIIEKEGPFHLIISDIRIPDIDGLTLLKQIKEIDPKTDVILITAYSSMETLIEALKEGASDYIIKPFTKDQMTIVVKRVLEQRKLKEENIFLRKKLEKAYGITTIIGKSKQLLQIFDVIEKIANLTSTVLITGESGTGKELVAASIHYSSDRRHNPFVTVNCGALPENLLESELFGHTKGSFTGAYENKQGLLEVAQGGTFFLDEVGDMTPPIQVKLLRFLNDKKFKRIGGIKDITVDVRIIAATNKNLEQLIKDGSFRSDLYYRLNVIPIHMPPLRERKDDIVLLANHFIEKYSRVSGLPMKKLTPAALNILLEYDWPGNVRELENVIERTIALETNVEITPESLPLHITMSKETVDIFERFHKGDQNLDEFINKMEKELLLQALERAGGKKKQAARMLNISFRSYRYRLEKHGLSRYNDTEGDETDDSF